MSKQLIARVRSNKISKQKTVTIPQDCEEIQGGDYVIVKKLVLKDEETTTEELNEGIQKKRN